MQLDAKALAAATAEIVQKHVSQAVAPLLRRIDALEGRPAPERGEKGDPGDIGPSGAGVVDVLRNHEGVLIFTLSDGRIKEVGNVNGKDGEQGPPGERGEQGPVGEKGEPGERGETGTAGEKGDRGERGEIGAPGEAGPRGEKGLDGKDGRDGFQLADFDARVLDDDRTIELSFSDGVNSNIATLKWPTVIDRGVFKADRDEPYQAGDGVTWGGSFWIAQQETKAKPDSAESGWRLAVKKGRDGKDAK